MERIRKPFQGTWNILRFNWHFYALSLLALLLLLLGSFLFPSLSFFCYGLMFAIALPTFVSLGVSFYIYDVSDLYEFRFLEDLDKSSLRSIVNIHAGFDETSLLLQEKFPQAELRVFDFYDPSQHTEVSIERARAAYPPFPNTEKITTSSLPLASASVDCIFLLFAAHEIRKDAERKQFFAELNRVLKPDGKLILVEHLRDKLNFCAYTIGFLHFLSFNTWQETFRGSGWEIKERQTITPFVHYFLLQKQN